jgi:hypothetical protein
MANKNNLNIKLKNMILKNFTYLKFKNYKKY